ncbi:MAG: alpha/beta hydrolase [Pseudomonadota bacterium]
MELDDAYDNVGYIPNAMSYPPSWSEKAAAYRESLKAEGRAELDIRYGDTERQAFDLFHPKGAPQGTMVFVHGGYWRRFDRSYWSHFAAGALAKGFSVAMPSYDLCPDVRIADITQQIARAVEIIAEHGSSPMVLTGHSAGGHLVSRMCEPGRLSDTTANQVARIIPISPVSDLRPLLRTSMNELFHLTEDSAAAESPVLMTNRLPIPVSVWVGANERPAFLDQARWQSEAWSCPLHIAPGKHHFDVIDALTDPDSDMMRDILSQTAPASFLS